MHKGSASFNQRRLSQEAPTRETKAGRESQGLEVCVPRNAVREKLPNSARKLLAKHNTVGMRYQGGAEGTRGKKLTTKFITSPAAVRNSLSCRLEGTGLSPFLIAANPGVCLFFFGVPSQSGMVPSTARIFRFAHACSLAGVVGIRGEKYRRQVELH